MSAVRVRRDVWDLGSEHDPWRDPAILAYATAVGAMQALARTDPSHGANWVNQAAIHERDGAKVAGRLEDQCQHGCWFFLPWHRMYLYRFEQIVRSHLPADAAEQWALPFWNYSSAHHNRRALPPAFRQRHLPDGTDNPLFVGRRQTSPLDINGGDRMPGPAVSLTDALRPSQFARGATGATPGFGGAPTTPLFHHSASGPFGPLEAAPHGAVHNQVGGASGLMTRFSTAALDPIFWLHHANIDRLWEQWLRRRRAHRNPTDSSWLTMEFPLIDASGARVPLKVAGVLEIEAQLGYTYSGLPAPPPPPAATPTEEPMPADDTPAELVGATDAPVELAGAATASAAFAVEPPRRPDLRAAARPAAVYLNVEDVEGEANPGLLYGVYVNLPEGQPAIPDSAHFAGTLSFFGIESSAGDDAREEAPHRLRYVFDITELAAALQARGRWDPSALRVTFAPLNVGPDTKLDFDPPPVRIGRVSLYVE